MCSTKASCLFEVSAVIEKSERVGLPPPFLVPKGGFVRMTFGLAEALSVGRQRVAASDEALNAVQHEIHQTEPVRVWHELQADKCVVSLKECVLL